MVSSRIGIQPFVCEISSSELRSVTASFWMCFYTLGFTAAIVLGVALPWRWSLGITAVILVLDLLALCTIHDSPQWLHKAGQYEAAEKSAAFYGLQAELKELISDEKVEKQGPLKPSSMQDKWEMAMNKLKQPTFYKPLGFLVVCMSSIELSCFPVISLYMVMIFQVSKTNAFNELEHCTCTTIRTAKVALHSE